MSCCGQKRNEYAKETKQAGESSPFHFPPLKIWRDTRFEYTGNSALTATGSATGKHYRFSHTGDTQLIDYRDVRSMLDIPVLKELS